MVPLVRLLGSYVLAGVRRRQALAIAALAGVAQYFVLVYSPPQLRALATDATPEVRGAALAIAWVLWMRFSRVLAWRLVLATDVRLLRHLPIGANRWRLVLAPQLVVLDLLVVAVAIYGLLPMLARDRLGASAWIGAVLLGALAWRVAQCTNASEGVLARALRAVVGVSLVAAIIVLDSPALAVGFGSLCACWAVWRLGRAFAEPRPITTWLRLRASRSPTLALARLYVTSAWALERPFVRISTAVQIGAMVLGALACVRVGATDPEGAIAGVRLFACAAAGMATWSALRVERRVAIDRWALDPHVASRTLDVGGRALAALAHAAPTVIAGVALAAMAVDGTFAIEMIAVALGAVCWSATATLAIAVTATCRDRMHEPRIAAQVVRLLAVGIVVVQLGALAFFAVALLELRIALTGWSLAERTRRRRARMLSEAERDG